MLDYELSRWVPRLLNGGLLLAIAQAGAFLYFVPSLFRQYWPALQEFFGSEVYMVVFGTFLFHAIQVVVSNLVYTCIYAAQLPFFEQYKVSTKVWPWKNPDKHIRDDFWKAVRTGALTVTFNNIFIGIPAMYYTVYRFQSTGAFDTSIERFPDVFTLVWQVGVCLLVEDSMFYWTHRFLHWKRIYKYIHKHHHTFYHSIVLASENAHPLEFLLGNLIPVAAGSILLRAHVFVFWTFVMVRIMETTDTHSGYEFPWTIARILPLSGATAAHDYHHSHNKGCFGSQFMVWDRVMGTDVDFLAFEAEQDQLKVTGKRESNDTHEADPDAEGDAAVPAPSSSKGARRRHK